MSTNIRLRLTDFFDDPWWRLTWVVPASVVLWAAMLVAFAGLLMRMRPAPTQLPPAQVRFLEIPPTVAPAPPAPVHHPAPARPKVRIPPPRPRIRPVPEPAPLPTHRIAKPAPQAPVAPSPPATNESSKPAPAKSSTTGSAINGPGSDSGGARAIFAPKPVIPDDLRDQVFHTVAVAHFEVSSSGAVQVTLAKPTDNPELNQVLLNTLREWRFFPAMRNGVPVDSQFDLRIPISVQ